MIFDCISDDIPPGYYHSNALPQFHLKLELCKLNTRCDVIKDVKLFLIIYCRIYCRKFLTLSNQTSHYKSKCIRILFSGLFPAILGKGPWPRLGKNNRLNIKIGRN